MTTEVKSCSTIGEGGDTTIPSPWRSPKQSLPGIGLHDPLHGWQACPELNSFHRGVGQILYVPGRGYFRAVPSQNGDTIATPRPPPIVERVSTEDPGFVSSLNMYSKGVDGYHDFSSTDYFRML